MSTSKIIWTKIDEAPALATYSLLPIVQAFANGTGVDVETRDISLAGRVIANFPDNLTEDQKIEDELSRQAGVEVPSSLLGEMVMDGLKPLDRVAYVRFASVYRNFQDIEEFQHFVDDLNARQRQEAEAREQEELPLS